MISLMVGLVLLIFCTPILFLLKSDLVPSIALLCFVLIIFGISKTLIDVMNFDDDKYTD